MVHSTVKNEHQENYRQWTKDTSDINVPLKTMGKTSWPKEAMRKAHYHKGKDTEYKFE